MNFYDLVIKKWWICVLCSGALFLLVSLAGWVLWYSGNIEGLSLADDKKQGHISYAVDRIARTLSRKIRSHRYRSWAGSPFHFKSLLMVFSVNEKQMLNQTVCVLKCYRPLQKISECYKAEAFALLWPVFFFFIYIIWLLFNRAVLSHWISIKKSSLYNYENMFFVLFDYQVYLKVT